MLLAKLKYDRQDPTTQYTTTHESSYFKPGEITLIGMFKGLKSADAPTNMFAAREVEMYLGPRIVGPQSAQAVIAPTLSGAIAPRDSAPPIAAPVAATEESPRPLSACSKDDQELAQLAHENGYKYYSTCK
jgi:hypothetical protein